MKNTTPSRKSALNITLSLGLITSLSLLSTFSSSSNALTKPLSFSSLIERYQKNQQLEMSIMHLDLDYIYDPDPRQMTRNINQLIKRIETVQPNTIFYRLMLTRMLMVQRMKCISLTHICLSGKIYLKKSLNRFEIVQLLKKSMPGYPCGLGNCQSTTGQIM
ncbi:hypothetical protein Asch01_02062 [Acinetobacter schindleri]